ncbi:MAG: hypothetical protein IJ859_04485 [Synergistaceae bacterium]|nr:hypothetical protein [Synergistaceae bacterium]
MDDNDNDTSDEVNQEEDYTTPYMDVQDTYSLNQLTGTWYVSNVSGTATGASGTYSLNIGVRATLGEFDDDGMTVLTACEDVDAYQNGSYVTTVSFRSDDELITLVKAGTDTWRLVFSYGNDNRVFKITLTSTTTASVNESGTAYVDGVPYDYSAQYTLSKATNNNETQNTYSLDQLSGTWVASSGSGTGTGLTGTYSFTIDHRAILGEFDTSGTATFSQYRVWYVYQDGYFVRRLLFIPDIDKSIKLTNIGSDTWKATFPDSDSSLTEGNVTITVTSATTAEVRETGSLMVEDEYYDYVAEYTMIKQ